MISFFPHGARQTSRGTIPTTGTPVNAPKINKHLSRVQQHHNYQEAPHEEAARMKDEPVLVDHRNADGDTVTKTRSLTAD